jgi:hypothetical protein
VFRLGGAAGSLSPARRVVNLLVGSPSQEEGEDFAGVPSASRARREERDKRGGQGADGVQQAADRDTEHTVGDEGG